MAYPAEASNKTNVGKSLSQLKTVEDLIKKFECIKQYRSSLERQWKLNLAFYKGRQYSYYPPNSSRLESLAVDEGSKPRHRVRIVSNQIMPGAHTLLAMLTKTKPRIFATPGSGAENEVRASQMANSLLEYWWQDMRLDEKLDEALLWSIIASSGYWKITWDNFASKQMRFMLDPQGNPITDDTIKQEFKKQLAEQGVEPQEKIVYMGDIKIDVMSPFDVYPDPTAQTFEECKFIVCKHTLDPDEIKARWGATVSPNATPATPDANVPYANAPDANELSVRTVYIGYFKPSPAMPNGRYVVWLDGSDKKILKDEKWPYPSNDLPFVKFSGLRVPGSVYDDSFVTHALPLQKELNRTVSQIVEYKNLTINPVMVAPIGSLRTRRTTEPGQVLEYAPIGNGLKPEFENLPTLPAYVFEHLADISARLQEIFMSPEVVQGKVPPNVEAGVAIDLLQEMATDKLAPIIKLIEIALAQSGQQMLSLAQKYYVEPRLMKIRGSGGSTQVKQFVAADIAGNISFHAEIGSGLPRTRAGKQARIEKMVELGIVPPNRAIRYFDMADLKGLEAQFQLQEEFAHRLQDKIVEGIPINPEAVQQAVQSAQQGINLDTGQALQSMQEAQMMVHNAGLKPPMGIDYDTHLDVVSQFMAGIEFDELPTATRVDFQTYYANLFQARIAAIPPPPYEAPKVSYQIRGTTGPTGASKLLGATGIKTTPEEQLEPPLETWISDSVDKPDTDAAGPGQEANQLADAAKTVLTAKLADAESKHAAAMKSVEHQQNVTHTQRTHQYDVAQSTLKTAQEGEKLRKMKAEADTAEKKARQSDFRKPKTTTAKKK